MSTIATVATDGSSAPGNSRRSGLTADQRDAIRRRLKRLTAFEVNPAKCAAGVHLAPVAAFGIAIRDAALDALTKLDDGTYGDCETCGCSIPIARLGAVPYARHCVACQERDEIGGPTPATRGRRRSRPGR
jgi:hypothetical protein